MVKILNDELQNRRESHLNYNEVVDNSQYISFSHGIV